MPNRHSCRRPIAAAAAVPFVLATCLLSLTGCGDDPVVESYEVDRTAPPRQPIDVAAERARLDHMFAAILVPPDAKQAWFFKLVAPGDQAAELRDAVESFLQSVQLDNGKPAWDAPDNWQEQAGDANRFATLLVPVGDGEPLELTVSQLPYSEPRGAYISANVNRWQRQLGEPALGPVQIEKLGETVATAAGDATLFELVGTMQANPMASPHGAMAGASPATPPAQPAPTQPAQSGELKFDTPDGWQQGRLNSMRVAAFDITGDGGAAEVTVMPFPNTPGMRDVTGNLQRWAGEVQLTGLSAEELKALAVERTIAGSSAMYAEFLGPDGDQPLATLAAMLPRGERIWFFKLKGDRPLVESQREKFGAFLDSVKFE